MLKRVLVPLDGSPLAETALSYARHIIDKTGSIYLLAVITNIDNFFVPTSNTIKKLDEQLKSARSYLNSVSQQLKTTSGLNIITDVKVGEPAQTIVEFAQHTPIDVIVMSTHGRSGVSKVIFGSVTQKVLQLTPCPVFIIPGRETVEGTQPAAQQLRPATN